MCEGKHKPELTEDQELSGEDLWEARLAKDTQLAGCLEREAGWALSDAPARMAALGSFLRQFSPNEFQVSPDQVDIVVSVQPARNQRWNGICTLHACCMAA